MFRVIRSTVQGIDIDEDRAEDFEAAIYAALKAGDEVRETVSYDRIGQKECRIALLPYTDPDGKHRWAVLDDSPAENDWQDTDDLNEAIAAYEEWVRGATSGAMPKVDKDGNEEPIWDETDVAGVSAKEVNDGESNNDTARLIAAQWAHQEFMQAEEAYQEATRRRDVAFAEMIDSWGRGGQSTLASRVELKEPTVKRIADRGREILRTRTVNLYEDNAGHLFLHRLSDDTAWSLGTEPTDGAFAKDAAAWVAGEWEPNENDGQTPVPLDALDGLEHIATWRPRGVQLIDGAVGPAAGGAGRAYLGLGRDV